MSFSPSPSRFWCSYVISALPKLVLGQKCRFCSPLTQPTGIRKPTFDDLSTSCSEPSRLLRFGPGFLVKTLIFVAHVKFNTDYNNMSTAELRALAREHGLRGYSGLRKAELIALFQDNLGRGRFRNQDPDLDKDSGLL